METLRKLFTEKARARYYTVATALVPVAVFYGAVEKEAAPLWLGVAAAVFGTGMARWNTSTRAPAE